jgi:Protein of unknown function DUF262
MTEFPEVEVVVDVEYDDEGRSTGVEREVLGDEIQAPFDPAKIDVQTRNPTVDLLLSRLRRGVLNLNADFQRKAGLWNDVAQSRLIESLLLRIPLPTLYAAETGEDGWTIVDGIQRLTTIARFVTPKTIGREALRLTKLEYLRDYDGRTYEELPVNLQTRIDETELVVHLIRGGTPEPVMFNIFARINTGGLPLTQQELRHALIEGKARDLLADLATNEAFLSATRGTVVPDRMADREMILRFLSFRRIDLDDYKYPDLDTFLRESMKQINSLPDGTVDALVNDFERSMRAASAVFGEHAFRKVFKGQKRRLPVNKALFEAVSVNLAKLDQSEIATLTERRDKAMDAIMNLMTDDQFQSCISYATGNPSRIRRRFSGIEGMLKEVIA